MGYTILGVVIETIRQVDLHKLWVIAAQLKKYVPVYTRQYLQGFINIRYILVGTKFVGAAPTISSFSTK